MNRLIIEETSVYELDEECVREKERERKNSQGSMEKEEEEVSQSGEDNLH